MNRVATILNLSLQIAANLSVVFEPFLPFACEKLRKILNVSNIQWSDLGKVDLLSVGHTLGEAVLLFEKIDDAPIDAQIEKLKRIEEENAKANLKADPVKENIEFETFEKLDIRVGTVLDCQKVPKADKLLVFKIDDGLGGRTIVSGIAKYYKPEDLVGKQVCFIANLAPRKLKGIESQGMILSCEDLDGNLVVSAPSAPVRPGSKVL
jgi:methionyl-tRNA synthetase